MINSLESLQSKVFSHGSARLLLELIDLSLPKPNGEGEVRARSKAMFLAGLTVSTLCDLRDKQGIELSPNALMEAFDLNTMVSLYIKHGEVMSQSNSIVFYLQRTLPRFDSKLAHAGKPQTPEVYAAHKLMISPILPLQNTLDELETEAALAEMSQ